MIQVHIVTIRIKDEWAFRCSGAEEKRDPKNKRIQEQILQFLCRVQDFVSFPQNTDTNTIISNFISFVYCLKLAIFNMVDILTYTLFVVGVNITTHH